MRPARLKIATTLSTVVFVLSAHAADSSGGHAQQQPNATPPSLPTVSNPAWSLKGIGLGSSPADLKAIAPTVSCFYNSDPRAVRCDAPIEALGSATSKLRVYYLDDKAVRVDLGFITYQELLSGQEALVDKYGPPTTTNATRISLREHPSPGDSTIGYTQPRWVDGDIEMTTVPDYNKTFPKQIVLSAITITDHALYDKVWVIRNSARANRKPDI